MFLHKYRSDSTFTEQIFETKNVWLSTPAELNDPFEGTLHEIDADWQRKKVTELKHAQLMGFLTDARRASKQGQFFGLTPMETRQLLARFKRYQGFADKYTAFVDFLVQRMGHPPSDPDALFPRLSQQLAEVGIFSLSEVADNPLMWAHYGDQHKGVCIGFEATDRTPLADKERCLRVTYSDTIPKMGDGFIHQLNFFVDEDGRPRAVSQIAFSDLAVRGAISTKSSDWAYEREWRYVEPRAGLQPWPGPIVELTFGLKCPGHRRDHYVQLIRDNVPNTVRFYEIRQVANSNILERAKLPVAPRIVQNVQPATMSTLSRLMDAGRTFEARTLSDQMLETHADNAEFWRLRGIACGQAEDHANALECFEHALRVQPGLFSAWYQKGVALTALGRYEDAIAAYTSAFEIDAREPSVAFNLGLLLLHQQDYLEARRYLELADRLGHPRASYHLEDLKLHKDGE